MKPYVCICVALFAAGSLVKADTLFYASVTNQYSGTPPGNILKVDSNGTASVWNIDWDTPIELFDPQGIAFDTHGDLFINDSQAVYKVDSAGHGTTFALKPDVYYAYGLAVDAQNNVYVGGAVGFDYAVYRYDSVGNQTAVWDAGIGVAYSAIQIGPDGALYTANVFSGEVFRIDQNTGVRTVYAAVDQASDLAFDAAGNLYVASETYPDTVYIVPAGGGTPVLYSNDAAHRLKLIDGMAVSSDGTLYVGNLKGSTNTIQAISTTGTVSPFTSLSRYQKVNSIAIAPTAVPEPGAWGAIVGVSLLGLAFLRRHRSR